MVSPVTVAVRVDPSEVVVARAPGLDVTVYWVIELPPSEAGADQITVTWVSPAVAWTFVGASGRAAGVTELEAADAAPVPMAFVAVTVKV